MSFNGDTEVVEGVAEGQESTDGESSCAEKGLGMKDPVELKV